MPLYKPGLKSALEALSVNPGASASLAAQKWADAMQAYMASVVPASATVATAAATLKGSLQSAFGTPAAAPLMELAFTAFGLAVGGGMVPFVATPPAGPVGFAVLFAAPAPSHSSAATAVSNAIDLWAKTGTGTLAPAGPIPWS